MFISLVYAVQGTRPELSGAIGAMEALVDRWSLHADKMLVRTMNYTWMTGHFALHRRCGSDNRSGRSVNPGLRSDRSGASKAGGLAARRSPILDRIIIKSFFGEREGMLWDFVTVVNFGIFEFCDFFSH